MLEIKVIDKDNVRIDKYLTEVTDYSRSKIQKIIDFGNISVNGKSIKNSYVVKMNDLIIIDDNEEENIELLPENINLDIVYEDEYLLVVNKPSGMVVHPGCGNYNHTLVNALMYHCNKLSSVNGSIRPGIVHRIDADTSGLLLVAKDDTVHNDLAKQISSKSVLRKYIALVQGVITEDSATIDAPIGRDKVNRKKMCVCVEGKDAITHIKVIERYNNATLIECELETGRTHQIRVHMDYIHHAVVNDKVYGHGKIIDEDFGQMLHAKELGFIHPKTGKFISFKVEPPDKFKEILDKYKND